MKNKSIFLFLLLTICILSSCGTATDPTTPPVVTPKETQESDAVAGGDDTELANPASLYCQEQGYSLEMRTGADGGQYGVCRFPDGSECEEWAFFRGECASDAPPALGAGQPVVGWMGHVLSTSDGAQFDDYVVLAPEGTGEFGLTGADAALEAEIVALRDKGESGKYANFWGALTCDVPDYNGCQLVVTRVRYGPTMSEPDPVVGWQGTLVSTPDGAQFDDYFVLDGDYPMRYGISSAVAQNGELELQDTLVSLRDTGTPFRVWGQLLCGVPDTNGCQIQVTQIEANGETVSLTPQDTSSEAPQGEPVEDWVGFIISNPPNAQFDDYFELLGAPESRFGIDATDPTLRQQLVDWRDNTSHPVHVWGTLYQDVPDAYGAQIQVTYLEVEGDPLAPPEMTQEAVEGWTGTIVPYPPGSQVDDYFARDDGQRYGIATLDQDVRAQLETHRWTGAQIKVWGQLLRSVPDAENRQIQVERVEAVSDPASEARNLSPLAEASASSALPSDRWGTYQAFSAVDGSLSTPWSEGAAGPGTGEWIQLTFPGMVEVHSVGVAVGYDREAEDTIRDPEIFEANNRLKRATLIFSNGEQVTLDFDDARGVQSVPLVRAPGPNIETTFVKLVIEEVYPGTRYDDTCLAEIEVWGVVK